MQPRACHSQTYGPPIASPPSNYTAAVGCLPTRACPAIPRRPQCVSTNDCTADAAQGCATCDTDNVWNCATCQEANYIVDESGYVRHAMLSTEKQWLEQRAGGGWSSGRGAAGAAAPTHLAAVDVAVRTAVLCVLHPNVTASALPSFVPAVCTTHWHLPGG